MTHLDDLYGQQAGASGGRRKRPGPVTMRLSAPARPDSYAAFCLLMKRHEAELPHVLSHAAAFMIANPAAAAFDTIAKLTARTGISGSAFVRLAQSCGFRGFSQLQSLFRQRLLVMDAAATTETDHGIDGLHGAAEAIQRSIARLEGGTNPEMFELAVSHLASAHTVFVVGEPADAQAVRCVAHMFNLGRLRNIMSAGSCGSPDDLAAFATSADAAIVLDLDPGSRGTADHLRRLSDRGIPRAIIAAHGGGTTRHAQPCLEIAWGHHAGPGGYAALLCLASAVAGAVQASRAANGGRTI